MEAGRPCIIPNLEGRRTTPSVVAFNKQGEILVGQVAKRQAAVNPTNTFFSIKRVIGRNYAEVESEVSKLPYTIRAGPSGNLLIESTNCGRSFAPEELSAQVLRKIVKDSS
jgi:molecular chaperone DnaK (HSP70)